MLWWKKQNSVPGWETGIMFVDKFILTLLQSAQAVQLRSFWTALLAVDNTLAWAFLFGIWMPLLFMLAGFKLWHFWSAVLWPPELREYLHCLKGAHWVVTDERRRIKIWLRNSVTGRLIDADMSLPGQRSLCCWQVSYIFLCCGSSPGAPAVLKQCMEAGKASRQMPGSRVLSSDLQESSVVGQRVEMCWPAPSFPLVLGDLLCSRGRELLNNSCADRARIDVTRLLRFEWWPGNWRFMATN